MGQKTPVNSPLGIPNKYILLSLGYVSFIWINQNIIKIVDT